MEPSRADYCHPYQPYDIQLEFMRSLYQCLETGKIGIFESPTGTGKSLSLICGALTWLRDHSRREIEGSFDADVGDDLDWLAVAEKASKRKEFLREREELEQKLASLRRNEATRYDPQGEARKLKRTKLLLKESKADSTHDDDEFLLDEYHSDSDRQTSTKASDALSSSTLALLKQLQPSVQSQEEPEYDRVKVIFCSRTHSQLTQFIHELQKVKPPSGLPIDGSRTVNNVSEESVKHLPLGSRKNLCINPKVAQLSSTLSINERCLDLQKPKVSKEHRCKFLQTQDDRQRVEKFRNRALATIRDIEDMANLGRDMELCPYYASRPAIAPSEVLTLPYPLLLQKSAREALGVSVKGNVVIIDEAHNLMDAISDTLSVTLTLNNLDTATKQIMEYVTHFKKRLKGQNRMYVTQMIRLLNSFTDCLRNTNLTRRNEVIVTTAQLMAGKGVDQIKPYKLLEYLIESKLAYKVDGYSEASSSTSSQQSRGVLLHIQSFLAVLMNPDSEGCFFVSKQDSDAAVRYTLLDPREHFRDIVEDARAVILAGGTMSPMSDYVEHLFSYVNTDRLQTFSFGHVVPKQNILAEPVVSGPNGVEFDFTFNKRGAESIIIELGLMVLQVCRNVPDGVVVFFPSYDYLAQVLSLWKAKPASHTIFDSLKMVKQVFEESRGSPVDELLRNYAQAIDGNKGGLLLSVVGGKLSEGINFSDRLGRAVVAVGLPFPNINGAEWKAKINHIEQTQTTKCQQQGISSNESTSLAKAAGREFYENACMRAVNQSIGRAIRHRDDYAAILLVDRRFATERIRRKLPQWIQSSMSEAKITRKWPVIEQDLKRFFVGK